MSLAEIIEGLTAGEMAGWGLVLLLGLAQKRQGKRGILL